MRNILTVHVRVFSTGDNRGRRVGGGQSRLKCTSNINYVTNIVHIKQYPYVSLPNVGISTVYTVKHPPCDMLRAAFFQHEIPCL
jgi:hypothetical protein